MSKVRKALEKAKQARLENNPNLFEVTSAGAETLPENAPEIVRELPQADSVVKSPPPSQAKAVDRGPVNVQRQVGDKAAKDVQVVYSRTRVQNIDPTVLKRNKLVALFPEMEAIEEIKILRTQVLNKLSEVGGNTFLVTSANPGEGKTFTCLNLGISISQELNKTVLIIDADLRDHVKSHYNFAKDFLNIDNEKGLSDYLLQKCELPELLLNPGIEKLTVIPAGKPLTNASELLGSHRMEELVQEVKERYKDRIIIIDGPAALDFSDPILLSKYVDGVLMVVEVEKTTSEQVIRLRRLFQNTTLLGAVVNKAK
jgi:non-specific protein-tyrosine kinase